MTQLLEWRRRVRAREQVADARTPVPACPQVAPARAGSTHRDRLSRQGTMFSVATNSPIVDIARTIVDTAKTHVAEVICVCWRATQISRREDCASA